MNAQAATLKSCVDGLLQLVNGTATGSSVVPAAPSAPAAPTAAIRSIMRPTRTDSPKLAAAAAHVTSDQFFEEVGAGGS